MNSAIHLLYAEDNLQDVDLLRAHFARVAPEFTIDMVASGANCLARLKELSYDLLLLDNRLPDMDGLDVLDKLNTQNRPPPVVLITGSGDDEIATRALRSGAVDYISKSDANYLETLPDLLRKLVARHRERHLSDSSGAQRMHYVLYVEPNTMDAALTQDYFKLAAPHLKLHCVTNSQQAFALLVPWHEFDLVLTDLRLPGMDALEFIREAQRAGVEIPFVVITGKGDEATAVAILRLGAYDYLIKRENYLVQLPHAIDHALHRFHLNQATRQLNTELAILSTSLEQKVTERTAELQREINAHKQTEQELRQLINNLSDKTA